MAEENLAPEKAESGVSRRRALAKLGIVTLVAYAAPSVLKINRNAHAVMASTPCPPADGNPNNNPPTCPP
jgi:hypothetical protein